MENIFKKYITLSFQRQNLKFKFHILNKETHFPIFFFYVEYLVSHSCPVCIGNATQRQLSNCNKK